MTTDTSRRALLIAAAALSTLTVSSGAAAQLSLQPPIPPSGPKTILGMVVFDGKSVV